MQIMYILNIDIYVQPEKLTHLFQNTDISTLIVVKAITCIGQPAVFLLIII